MRSRIRTATAIAGALLLSSCLVGPHQLRRSVDDWDQKTYVNSPWLDVAMWVVPVFPACHAVAFALDTVITDPWAFWTDDAWDGNGTGFRHMRVDWTDGYEDSLLNDRAKWTKVNR